jgi:polyisoprenoid-binding protein YceI
MGHRHTIRAQQFTGSVEWDSALPEAVRIDLVIDAKSLKVTDDDLDPGDVAKVQQDMETKVLEVEKYPEIHFLSNVATLRESSEGKWALDVSGSLLLHGVSQPVVVPLTVEMSGNVLHLQGETTLRQKDYEIEPVSVGLGTVKVKNEVKIQFNLVAEAPPPTAAASDSAAADSSGASLE